MPKQRMFDRHGRQIDDEILPDGGRVVVPMRFMDGVPEHLFTSDARIVDAFGTDAGLHRPGSRYLAAGQHTAADQAAFDRVEQARDEAIAEMCDAWKGKPDATGEARGSQDGDVCMTDDTHEPGHIDANGRCVADREDARRTDAVPKTMDAATAQTIRDRAYEESVAALTGAWRTP